MNDNRRVDFDAIKARADFRAVLAHFGLPQGRGVQFKISCPFHADGEPSCSINTDEKVFHCFGTSCNAKGNVLDFVHRMEAQQGAVVSIRQAAIRLTEICGIPLAEVSTSPRRSEAPRAPNGTPAGSVPPKHRNPLHGLRRGRKRHPSARPTSRWGFSSRSMPAIRTSLSGASAPSSPTPLA